MAKILVSEAGTRIILDRLHNCNSLAKENKNYMPGSATDTASKRKAKDYQWFFQINKAKQWNILFFACFGKKQGMMSSKVACKVSGDSIGSKIQPSRNQLTDRHIAYWTNFRTLKDLLSEYCTQPPIGDRQKTN